MRDCIVSGSASDIYLALWNRCPLDNLQIDGDRTAIDVLRDRCRSAGAESHNQSRLRNIR